MSREIILKNDIEIMKIAAAGHYNALFFSQLAEIIRPGISTMDIEDYANEFCQKHQVHPCFKDVPNYHWAVCTAINEEVVHGIPHKHKVLKAGDLITVDIGIKKDGVIADSAQAYLVGEVSPIARKLYDVTRESLNRAIAVSRPGSTLGDIGYAIQSYVEAHGFSVVREYVGHGVGFELHEAPTVYHFGERGKGMILQEGMVIAIEPMINEGSWQTEILKDGWTVVTKDRKLSCQVEHTVAITKYGPRILTI